jgi:hypothetical protein
MGNWQRLLAGKFRQQGFSVLFSFGFPLSLQFRLPLLFPCRTQVGRTEVCPHTSFLDFTRYNRRGFHGAFQETQAMGYKPRCLENSNDSL